MWMFSVLYINSFLSQNQHKGYKGQTKKSLNNMKLNLGEMLDVTNMNKIVLLKMPSYNFDFSKFIACQFLESASISAI